MRGLSPALHVQFGLFVKSLGFRVEAAEGVNVVVMVLFLITPILSMRYGGGRHFGLNVRASPAHARPSHTRIFTTFLDTPYLCYA